MTIKFEVVDGRKRFVRFVVAKSVEEFNLHIRPLFVGVDVHIIAIV